MDATRILSSTNHLSHIGTLQARAYKTVTLKCDWQRKTCTANMHCIKFFLLSYVGNFVSLSSNCINKNIFIIGHLDSCKGISAQTNNFLSFLETILHLSQYLVYVYQYKNTSNGASSVLIQSA